MLIFGSNHWPGHRRWFFATTAIGLAAATWHGVESTVAGRWLGGGSRPGLSLGVAGGLIIVFEMLLWPRKKFRLARVGRAVLWMKAHIWLGLLSVPLLLLHAGPRWWGGALGGVLMFTFLAVIASGVWGLALQQVLPRAMMEGVPAEAIRSEMASILAQYLEEASAIVRMTCGVIESEPKGQAPGRADRAGKVLVIGAVRTVGIPQGQAARVRDRVPFVPGSLPLLAFFEETVKPYLQAPSGNGSPLASSRRAGAIFRNVRGWLDPEAHGVVDHLEDLCDRRRQFDLQARLHGWLHGWLCIHLPLSVSMFLLMVMHVYFAFKYF